VFNAENSNSGLIVGQVQQALAQIRAAQELAQHLRDFTESVSFTELTTAPPDGPGMSAETAQGILDACADAWGHAQLYQTGTDPRGVAAGYVYGASQKRVLGSTFR
jgi:hypothetical protein